MSDRLWTVPGAWSRAGAVGSACGNMPQASATEWDDVRHGCTLSAFMRLTEVVAENKRIFGRDAGGRNEGLTTQFRNRSRRSMAQTSAKWAEVKRAASLAS